MIVICVPTMTRPHPACLDAIEAAIPLLEAARIEHRITWEVGCPYISAARATMAHRAFAAGADEVLFLDHDVSFGPEDLLKLIQTPGDVVAGFYRFKTEPEEYMGGIFTDGRGIALVREDGCIQGLRIPAGFMKITRAAVARFAKAYPHLCYGDPLSPAVDLFNHGAHEGAWYGEDYAFSRNWLACGGDLWVVPDLNLTHHSEAEAYPGNYHLFLRRQPGGDLAEAA